MSCETEPGGAVVSVVECRHEAEGLWEGPPAGGLWNYGHREPLVVLNLAAGTTWRTAAVACTSSDELRIRTSADPEDPLRPGFLHQATVLRRQR